MTAVNGAPHWQCGRFRLSLARVQVMAILNVTPDSFSDGGRFNDPDAALAQAQAMLDAGADILDIGAESTRPGSLPVDVSTQTARLKPVLQRLRDCPVPISVDTSEPEVMRMALAEGASIINDVRAFDRPGAIEAVRDSGCGLVVMHRLGEPLTMQDAPSYDDVVREVDAYLGARTRELEGQGIARDRIVIDPGFGFGKRAEHSRSLLRGLACLTSAGVPVLVGLSRKSFLGRLTGKEVSQRLPASLAGALIAAQGGARILRVHDVAETRDVLAIWQAVAQPEALSSAS